MNIINTRLANLRNELNKQQLDAIIVPTADPHLSEYLPSHWQLREWLSGFTGSAGTLVVTTGNLGNHAYLWADSRYWVQAEHELADSEIELQKLSANNTYSQWLASNSSENTTITIDSNMVSVAGLTSLQHGFANSLGGNSIQIITDDSIAQIWQALYQAENSERPALPTAKLFRHNPKFVSVSASEKLVQVRQGMEEHGATHHLLSSLDDIAWLTNLRGADVDYNPVFLSHLLISQQQATLFIDNNKVSADIAKELKSADIELADYNDLAKYIAGLTVNDSLLIDPNKVAVSSLLALDKLALDEQVKVIKKIAPSTLLKSVKSSEDINNIREAMRQDGVALCEFFAEFERRMNAGDALTELDVDSMLIDYRSQQANYVSPSFPTIAGFNGNGALPHYRATEDSFSKIEGDGLLLIDSGAQYHNGTTDITRVVPIGNISHEHKRDFTAVLKAHIALATAYFPEGISSPSIDAICRAPLWAMQMDYGHGTGHGVGYFINVHEGPQGIAYSAPNTAERAMRAGMITSNEPALYREGQWGIRIENLVANMAVENPQETQFGDYLYFETVTYCPIDTRLVNKAMLTEQEVNWLNNYHSQVFDELSNRTDSGLSEQGLAWLTERTKAV